MVGVSKIKGDQEKGEKKKENEEKGQKEPKKRICVVVNRIGNGGKGKLVS